MWNVDFYGFAKTSQQQISRLESTGYEEYSLSMLRRATEALHASVRGVFEPDADEAGLRVAEGGSEYGVEKYAMRFHQHEMV